MSTAPAAVAPAAPAVAPGKTDAPKSAAPKTVAPTKPPEAPQDSAPAWGEKDEAELIERLKKSPYGKRKVNGKEEALGSPDDLKRWLLQSQMGVGANRLVEEAKREKEQAAKEASEAKALKEALARLKKGDRAAARELGLESGDDEEARVIESLPPEVRDIIEQNKALVAKMQEAEKAEKARLEEEKARKSAAEKEATLKTARQHAEALLADVRPEMLDVELPSLIQAMESLRAQGLKLGVDYTQDQLKAYVEEHRTAEFGERVGRLKPAAAAKMLGPILKGLKPEEVPEVLGENWMAVGRLFSEAWTRHWKAKRAAPPQPPAPPTKEQEPAKPRQPLSPFRFQR